MELLASYHFLRKIQMKDHVEARTTICEEKNHLIDGLDSAKAALEEHHLLT
jgi:hypothetical protein